MPSEKYQPTDEEMKEGQSMLSVTQGITSERREKLLKGIDLELLKKCKFTLSNDGVNQTIMGIADEENIFLQNKGNHTYGAVVNGQLIEDKELAKELWDKFFPIARALESRYVNP